MVHKFSNAFSFIRNEFIFLISSILIIAGCSSHSVQKGNVLFKKLPSSFTGLSFANTITETDSMNLITNEYAYMGGGIGIGDFNNDGNLDLVVTNYSSMVYRSFGSRY